MLLSCIALSNSALADLNEKISIAMTKAAQEIILEEENLDGVNIDKALKLTKQALDTSQTIMKALAEDQSNQLDGSSRRQDEARYLSSVSAYPFIKLSKVGYLYQIQQEAPLHNRNVAIDGNDTVRIRIEAHSNDGISLVSEREVITPLTKIHSAFSAMIREMKKGETRKAFFPSSILFGGNKYMDILPYSTIIASVTLIDISSSDLPTKTRSKQASTP